MKILGFAAAVILILFYVSGSDPAETDTINDASHKNPTTFTINSNKTIQSYLAFEDKTDYENAKKGFIATLETGEIYNEDGALSYSMKQFDFIKGDAPTAVNPSLWRQSELNSINGLFKVKDGIYQVRGFDLANITFIKGETGWIIVDPLTSPAPAKAALTLVDKELGKFPVISIIYTHSHIDHFGGVRGLVSDEDIKSGAVKIYAPEGFFEHSISENVMAGNAMSRRSVYMYGNLLPKNITGTLGSGLGTTTSKGLAGIMEPTDIITSLDGETKVIDGVEIEFLYTPGAEAPAELMFYLPELKAICQSEEVNRSLHNLYTLRGAQIRNGQKWSQYIDSALAKWGTDAEVSFGSHHWPTWGNDNIVSFYESQRDVYRFIHDQTLRMANQGITPKEIAQTLKLPESLDKEFSNRGYYGSVSHNAKAQYQLYFGWFDANPANLNPLPPVEAGQKYVEAMGGADALLVSAKASYDKGEYRWVAELVNNLVFAEPKNQQARNLLADAYEQMGYQAESGPWRNFYLTGAQELRVGVRAIKMAGTASKDMLKGMTSELYFNFLAMQFLGTENGALKYNFNIVMPDVKENLALIVSNGAVTPRMGTTLSNNVTATITINRSDLNKISLKEVKFEDLLAEGIVTIAGDKDAYLNFLSKIDVFNFWFNIIEP